MKKKITTGDIVEIIGDELTPIGWNEEHAKRIDGIPELAQRIVKLFAIPDVSGSLPFKKQVESKAAEFADKRYYKETNPHETTVNDFKAGVEWLLGYMESNDH